MAQQVTWPALASPVARLMLQLPAVQLGTDPGGVHQARVAARRLRSDLKTFKCCSNRSGLSAHRPSFGGGSTNWARFATARCFA